MRRTMSWKRGARVSGACSVRMIRVDPVEGCAAMRSNRPVTRSRLRNSTSEPSGRHPRTNSQKWPGLTLRPCLCDKFFPENVHDEEFARGPGVTVGERPLYIVRWPQIIDDGVFGDVAVVPFLHH